MRSMAINRRGFLGGLLAAGCLPPPLAQALVENPEADFVHVTARQRDGRFEAVVLDARGQDHYVVPLEARAHGFALNRSNREAVAFGRQPGFFGVRFHLDGKAKPRFFEMPEGRHFFGHGSFADKGRLLLTTENDYEEGRSVLGVYDALTLERKGEWQTNGIGAHEVIPMPDGKTLCVANGGILTHPDYGRAKLNLDSMSPSLVYLDMATGEVLEEVKLSPDLHQLSIRHMAVDRFGAVWFGCQYEGPASDDPPLVGRHVRGRPIDMVGGPTEARRGCKHYIGSVTADSSGTLIATSSPVGGCVLFWDAATGNFLGTAEQSDVCGLGAYPAKKSFASSTGNGRLERMALKDGTVTAEAVAEDKRINWDNHIATLLP